MVEELGDGKSWNRKSTLGEGNNNVYLAILKKNTRAPYSHLDSKSEHFIVVKSAYDSDSAFLREERHALLHIIGFPDFVQCFGEEITVAKNGKNVYNLLFEYCAGGTLADKIKSDGKIPEFEAREYVRSIVRALDHIHGLRYVHGDLTPENIFLVPIPTNSNTIKYTAKLGGFGAAKKMELNLMYSPPEDAKYGSVQGVGSDIWAVACILLEMLTAKKPWHMNNKDLNDDEIRLMLGKVCQIPDIPGEDEISVGAMRFLTSAFIRKSTRRCLVQVMLLSEFLSTYDTEIDEDDEDMGDEDDDEDLLIHDTDDGDTEEELDKFIFRENNRGFSSDEEDFAHFLATSGKSLFKERVREPEHFIISCTKKSTKT